MKYLIVLITTGIIGSTHAQNISTKHEIEDTMKKRKIKHYDRTMEINGAHEDVFAFMDEIRNTGSHMTEKSNAMMGSKLTIQWLSDNQTGLGTKYRWTGKTVGMKMDFTVEVTKWVETKEKVWGTVGDANMIVIDWFEMYLITSPEQNGKTNARLGIYYAKKESFLGFLLGTWYSKWCVKSMLKDTRKHFKSSAVEK